MNAHHQKLINMYLGANIQAKFPGINLTIDDNYAEITLPVDESYHHAGGYLHGSIYFRLLDDVTYFAAMSNEEEHFYVTKSFSIEFLRPVQSGLLTAKSEIIKMDENEFFASGSVYAENGKQLAKGEGVFAKGRMKLDPSIGYRI